MPTKKKSQDETRYLGFRADPELYTKIQEWRAQNAAIDISTLLRLAVFRFISSAQVLEPVKVETASNKDFESVADAMMGNHADAMDKLKDR